jgi:hypothetical protein
MVRKNKKGWIKIVEAVIALLLIAGVLLVVINKGYIGRNDVSKKVYDIQLSILREIELNSELRNAILEIQDLPVGEDDVPESVKNKILERKPDYLTCRTRICALDDICEPDVYVDRDIYAQAVAISASPEMGYAPRKIKLFCWIV